MAVKKRTDPDWSDLRVFATFARRGTLSAAARALKINHATVARRIASLEQALKTRLVERRPHQFVLTPDGQAVLQAAMAMEKASAGLISPDPAEKPRGLVRIAATPSLVDTYLVAKLGPLRRQHPMLDIELASGIRPTSLARHEADLALRVGRPASSDLVGRKLASLAFGIYASDEWRARLERGEQPQLIGFDEANSHLVEAQLLQTTFPENRIAFQASSQLTQARAAVDGYGVALLPRFVATQFRSLRQVVRNVRLPTRELWLLNRREDAAAWPIAQTREFLITLFNRDRALFEE